MLCWEANIQSVNREIPRILWKPKVCYRVHKSPPLFPTLRQMHPVHNLPPYFPDINCNIIFPSTSMSSKWSLPFRFSNQNIACISHLSHPCYIPCPFHPPWAYHPNNTWCSIQVMKLFICSLLQSLTPSLLLGPYSPQHPVIKHPQYMCERPYKTTGKIMVLCLNLFVFREETGRQKTPNRMVSSIPRN